MKRRLMKLMGIVVLGMAGLLVSLPCPAQKQELEQLVLDIQKLAQLKKVLQTMYRSYKILATGYEKVKDMTEGNFSLHETYLDGLMVVSPEVKKYQRIADIIRDERDILSEYKRAFKNFRTKNLFSPEELEYMAGVYGNLVRQAAWNIDELVMVITSGNLRMSDAERLSAIDRLFEDTRQKLVFLRNFNRKAAGIAAQRQAWQQDISEMKQMFGTRQ